MSKSGTSNPGGGDNRYVGKPKQLEVIDLGDRELQEEILKTLRIISKKLDCLSDDNETFDEFDLDSIEQ